MTIALEYTTSFIIGVLMGLFFLQGLWVTIRNIDKTRHPALRLLVSILVRFILVLAGFFFLARYAGWQHVLTAVVGFSLLRIYIVRRFSREQEQHKGAE